MEDLSLHILDIAENSIAAGANRIEIRITENEKEDSLLIEIKDNGRGMSEEITRKAADPFYTTRTTRRVGIGLSLLKQAAEESEGAMQIISKEGTGTTISARFMRSHIDRKPIGNMAETMIVLISGNPNIDFFYEHGLNGNFYSIDTGNIRKNLGGVPINSPDVIRLIKNDLDEGLENL